VAMVKISRFDICLINLDPTLGSEIRKTRPCLIISPNSMNHSRLNTIIIAPMTTVVRENFPTRIDVEFNNKKGHIALDQIRTIERQRIIKVLGGLNRPTEKKVLQLLQIMFS